jgi:hypothetical protein
MASGGGRVRAASLLSSYYGYQEEAKETVRCTRASRGGSISG